jgi:hypothetical protein
MFETGPVSQHFGRMHADCPACGLHFEPEPGFFWGSMYITYAFSMALFLMTFAALSIWAPKAATWVYLVLIISINTVLLPWSFRYSRVLMLYWFSPWKFDAALWEAAGGKSARVSSLN